MTGDVWGRAGKGAMVRGLQARVLGGDASISRKP